MPESRPQGYPRSSTFIIRPVAYDPEDFYAGTCIPATRGETILPPYNRHGFSRRLLDAHSCFLMSRATMISAVLGCLQMRVGNGFKTWLAFA